MSKLKEQHCDACRADAPRVTDQERESLQREIPDWQVIDVAGEHQLMREFRFRDFAAALVFTNQVAELAEAENHHPALLLEYGKVTVRWWTHKIGGLHRNDFIMGARTDLLA
ncbi:4a-hydroxytetrahydrobiopterin dehydratase [Halopseudomonas litoralis]|uniref:Putative pterin-4-alpha-carbinolamine dehydratase n=1 Tax=Halopseudomonas litoralis TaxID=797277 RepID=A0A1H1MAS1_9GAMM|nr:4a-hydroxytetrahydrobiopterin dehydratase [Halopseudomonas litoralis]SDR83475.1 4a-hydroxytetrahydrobiopterin dehydratase [Halopseudomonas litoralis]